MQALQSRRLRRALIHGINLQWPSKLWLQLKLNPFLPLPAVSSEASGHREVRKEFDRSVLVEKSQQTVWLHSRAAVHAPGSDANPRP